MRVRFSPFLFCGSKRNTVNRQLSPSPLRHLRDLDRETGSTHIADTVRGPLAPIAPPKRKPGAQIPLSSEIQPPTSSRTRLSGRPDDDVGGRRQPPWSSSDTNPRPALPACSPAPSTAEPGRGHPECRKPRFARRWSGSIRSGRNSSLPNRRGSLSMYADYYNEARTHMSLRKDAPIGRPVERFGRIIADPMVGGLHYRYARI
jgi:hypothetical protein